MSWDVLIMKTKYDFEAPEEEQPRCHPWDNVMTLLRSWPAAYRTWITGIRLGVSWRVKGFRLSSTQVTRSS